MLSEFRVIPHIQEVTKSLAFYERYHIPFATALALTRTAKFVQQKQREEMQRVFDRPKAYTLNSTWVRPATKERQVAEVKIKDEAFKSTPPIKWLRAEIYGGARRQKAYEALLRAAGVLPPGWVTVPGAGAPMDAYGNIATSEINRMLSDLRSRRDPLQNSTAVSRRRRLRSRTRRAYFYFSSWPVRPKTKHLRPGIYRRSHFGFGTAITPVLIFVRSASYRRRFRFHEVAEQVSRMRFRLEFPIALRHAVRTAR